MIWLQVLGYFLLSFFYLPNRSGLEDADEVHQHTKHKMIGILFPKVVRAGKIPSLEAVRIDPGHLSAISTWIYKKSLGRLLMELYAAVMELAYLLG